MLALAGLLLAGCGAGEADGGRAAGLERPNIVLISIDTLRADHLGSYGYFRDTSPHLDRFAERAIRFERVRAPMATTLPSHTSMLTGRYPLEHGVLANVSHGGTGFGAESGLLSFTQVLQDAGYRTGAFVSALPLDRSTGIGAGFETYDQPEQVQRAAQETLDPALAWLAQASAGEEPFFLFVHLFDPHGKRHPPEPFLSRYETDDELEAWIAEREIGDFVAREWKGNATNTRTTFNRYGGEIRYADDQLGRLFGALASAGHFGDSLVTVVADHGDGLNQHGWVAHGLVWEEHLRVPWLLHVPGPGEWPAHVTANVSLIDLFPTLIGRMQPLGTPLSRRFDEQVTGVDVLAPEFVERPIFAQRTGREIPNDPGPIWALVDGDWKFVLREREGDALFDLARDPHELVNRLVEEPARAAEMRAALLASIERQRARGAELGISREAGPADPERIRQLELLGYLGADSGSEDALPEDH